MRNIIILVNHRFIPTSSSAPYPYGVTQHVLHIAELLRANGTCVGFLLYLRDEEARNVTVSSEHVLERYPASRLTFSSNAPPTELRVGVQQALSVVADALPGGRSTPLLYMQTSFLLPHVPQSVDVLLTHHSPFVSNVRNAIGSADANRAFDWDHPKADFLARTQAEALAVLRRRDNAQCAEISQLQVAYLLAAGVPSARVHRLPPPVAGRAARGRLPAALRAALRVCDTRAPIALTAVARFDLFKNIELFLEGCYRALSEGTIGHAVVIGGAAKDAERERLTNSIPTNLRGSVTFIPRLPHAQLVGQVFPKLAGRAVFVCTSRFDLVPYTALEAARAGVWTVVPNHGRVGAAEYLPQQFRFDPHADGVAAMLRTLLDDPLTPDHFRHASARIRRLTSDTSALNTLVRLVSLVSVLRR